MNILLITHFLYRMYGFWDTECPYSVNFPYSTRYKKKLVILLCISKVTIQGYHVIYILYKN